MSRPVVTRAEFAALTCNRCGDCCERFSLPLTPLSFIVDGGLDRWTRQALEDRYTREAQEAARRLLLWLAELEPLPEAEQRFESLAFRNNRQSIFRCARFVRESPSQGHCSIYEHRPDVCRNFPVNFPNGSGVDPENLYEHCAFNVDVVDEPTGTVGRNFPVNQEASCA